MNKDYKENHKIKQVYNQKVNMLTGIVIGFMIGLSFQLVIRFIG